MSQTQPPKTIVEQIDELREALAAGDECIGEQLTQFRSETALYGDAGPGQHPSLWLAEAQATQSQIKAQLEVLYQTPEGKEFLEAEARWRASVFGEALDI